MNIRQTENKSTITKILNHPKVYKWISEDCSPYPYEPNMEFLYLIDDTQGGVVQIVPFTGVSCIVHIALLPKMWGKGYEFVNKVIEWSCKNTRYMKAIAIIPDTNRLTIKLVRKIGFKKEGTITSSFLKDWKLHDQLILGLTKGEIACQQQ